MKVYIAGPMTGYVDHNFPAFNAAAARLVSLGHEVVNPAEMDEGMTAEQLRSTPHEVFMRRDIRVLVDCDAIYLLPGWRHSKGATLESAVAKGCGIVELRDPDTELWRTFEGEPLPEPGFMDIEVEVDDSLPPGVIRLVDEKGAPLVDFEILPADCDGLRGSECSKGMHVEGAADTVAHLTREAAEAEALDLLAASISHRHSQPRPGDKFPNVAYVRDMTGVTAAELADNCRRLSTAGMSVFEVAEAVNARYVAESDGRGVE